MKAITKHTIVLNAILDIVSTVKLTSPAANPIGYAASPTASGSE